MKPRDTETKRQREKALVGEMIALYCKKRHGTKGGLCPECAALAAYARERSEKCPFMETKTFCSNCRVHCYDQAHRQRIKEVMRFSGPRMLMHHPLLALSHLIESKKEQRRLKEENR